MDLFIIFISQLLLQNVKNLIWIVCDDSIEINTQVVQMLQRSGIHHQYILSKSFDNIVAY